MSAIFRRIWLPALFNQRAVGLDFVPVVCRWRNPSGHGSRGVPSVLVSRLLTGAPTA
ncbi:hypothetical protein ACLK1T_19710 [Escherichia coli]